MSGPIITCHNGDITTHYSAPELKELIEVSNRVCRANSGTGCSASTDRRNVVLYLFAIIIDKWYARRDSNPRPPGSKPGTLSN